MDDYLNSAKMRRKNIFSAKKVNLKPVISKFLLAIIFFLVSVIFTNMSDKNLLLYKEYVLTESMPFTKIKGWYEDLFGEVLPNSDNNKMVMSGHLVYKSIDKYLDGEVLTLNNNTLINNLTSGIVVYSGEKEGYGNTVIVQSVDGADIWYGNITNVSVKLYDYVEKDKLIGEVNGDKLYLVIKKDNNFIKYEDYQI
jgi:stage IV sporulation protein FA